MKTIKPLNKSWARFSVLKLLKPVAVVCLLALIGTAKVNAVDWFGYVSPDWNNADNWQGSLVPDAVGCAIQTIGDGSTTFTATITNDVVGRPSEIVIGGWWANGRVDHQAGTLGTQNVGWPPGWVLIGFGAQGTATYNLADTTTTGGALTGFGTGSGTLNIWDALFMGEPGGGNGNGISTLNVNTTGSLNVTNDFNLGVSGWNATMNLDAGTVTDNLTGADWQGQVYIPRGRGNNSNSVTTGVLNMGGGTFTTGYRINVGSCDSTETYTNLVGVVNLNGGTMTANGVNWWASGVRLGANGGSGTFNLNGGTLACRYIFHEGTNSAGAPNGTAIFNFNGGVLKPTQSRFDIWDSFMGGWNNGDPSQTARFLTAANVQVGGAIIDTAGYNIWIQQPLLTGTNITDGGLTKNGNGILRLSGTNSFTGPVVVNGGTLEVDPGNAATDRAFNHASSITINTGAKLQSGANGLFGWSDATPTIPTITVNAGGTLTATNVGDVHVRQVVLAGGSLQYGGTSPTYGSWAFTGTGAGLTVTENTTVDAADLRFSWFNEINVASTKTLELIQPLNTNSHIWKSGLGKVVLHGANTSTGPVVISQGTVALASGATIANAPTIEVTGTLDASADGSFNLGAAQELLGTGTVIGNVLANGAVVPGYDWNTSIGALTVNGNLTLAGSTLIRLNKDVAPSNSVLKATGTLVYGGTLTVTNLGTTALALGDSFQLFTNTAHSGSFAVTNLPTLGAGLGWNFNPNSGVLSVVSVSSGPSGPAPITSSYSGGVLTLTWPSGVSWRLESQTNNLSTGLSATGWSTVTGVSDGSATITVDPAAPSVFYRLVYP